MNLVRADPNAVCWIGGKFIKPQGQGFSTINPATEEELCSVFAATPQEVNNAVAAAQAAFPGWAALPGSARGKILKRAAQILRERKEELARLEVLDTGKPVSEALETDIDSGADCLDYFAQLAATLQEGERFEFNSAHGYTRREPLGACAGIGAWNYPLQIACWKAAPALACGNTMVFKPSELTVLTTLKLAQILGEAGLPDGVFNVVLGAGDVGQALAAHPDIAKISLTGSVATGRKIMEIAAPQLKPVTLELGGKSPLIVFDDADINNAVSGAMLGNFYTQGEVCSNGTRVFVHRRIHKEFMARLLARTEKLVVGDPLDPKTQIGALISRAHMERVLSCIEKGQAEGARLLSGGTRVGGTGFFVRPAIFDACHDEMTICREEIFGPVMSVLVFDDEDEVVQRANNTPFGLAGGVFTRDGTRGQRVAERLEAGVCWINSYNITPVEMPFGGVKQSGLGRENGRAALEHYTRLKSIYVQAGDMPCPW